MMDATSLTEKQIDQIVVSEANDDSAWETPIVVEIDDPLSMTLPPDLAAKAAFFAQLHNMATAEEWLKSIIQERIQFEESAFSGLKRVLEKRAAYKT